jgi:hypothetical protein
MFAAEATRIGAGIIVALYGDVLLGRRMDTNTEQLDSLTTSHLSGGPTLRVPPAPDFGVNEAHDTLNWWIGQLNELIEIVLDVTLFADGSGRYDPAQHAGYVMSVERLFAAVNSSLALTGRDEYSRRMHLFETLDLIEGLRLGGYDVTLDSVRVRTDVERLRADLPSGVAAVLLPRCDSSVEGLETFADSFHPRRIDTDGLLRVTSKKGVPERIKRGKATSQYLRVVRNAGHGLRDELQDPHSLSLLAAHEGNIPAAISDVAYLQLIRLVSGPSVLAAPLLR